MFQHLPKVSEDNLMAFGDKEMDWVIDLVKQCLANGTETLDGVIDCACEELNRSNPCLVKAIRGTVYGVAGDIEGEVEKGLEWRAGLATIPGILVILRLIDRAIEAKSLEAQLLEQSTLKK